MLVIVASLCFAVRLGEFVTGLSSVGSAFAQQEIKEGEASAPPPLPGHVEAGDEGHADEAQAGQAHDKIHGEEPADKAGENVPGDVTLPTIAKDSVTPESEKAEWRDAGEEDFNYSGVQESLYKDLTQRREDLEKREKALATRQALLEAAERELDQKVRELTALRGEIEGLLVKQSEEEIARTQSLVRIYEGMKAKDAARIFNTLDTDVLLQVLTKMSERKSSPILAEMDPERARTITILMAQQQQLPALPPQ
ncbi:MAG: flagellar protein FlbB [Micavibrio aeruginosavorus]|uniref:Flagellar protein FlbB n=1 Tax=Micavibrio aeruginosavorus TaxID=349221 RepID=A0A7T5R4L4_9BACT|nr:MAG: flagellar protein FlbB [Micavibrio aeruginosavorus]